MNLTISESEAAFFREEGYVCLPDVLTTATIHVLERQYDAEVSAALRAGSYKELAPEPGKRNVQVFGLAKRNTWFRAFASDSSLVGCVRTLLGAEPRLLYDQALLKPAQTGAKVNWHQDNSFWRCSPPRALSCWLALEDVDNSNGALLVLPRLHHSLLTSPETPPGKPVYDLASSVPSEQAVVLSLPVGSVAFFHCLTPHASTPNVSYRPRRAYVTHFADVEAECGIDGALRGGVSGHERRPPGPS